MPDRPLRLKAVLRDGPNAVPSKTNSEYPTDILRIQSIEIAKASIPIDPSIHRYLRLYSIPNTPSAALSFPLLKTDMNDPLLLEQVRHLTRQCQDHPSCPDQPIPRLPKRVIDVGSRDRRRLPRLHVNTSAERACYTALSYCWGAIQQLTTTRNSLAELEQEIPEENLSKTIRDAIEVTRGLGIQYLWADALCIIQDSGIDKTTEINSMGKIYKNATLTIAATSAKTAADGFLGLTKPLAGGLVPFLLRDCSTSPIKMIAPQPDYYPGQAQSRFPDPNILDTRGWALQEFLLSPRLLLFGSEEVLWQCQTESLRPLLASSRTYYPEITRLPSSVFGVADPLMQKSAEDNVKIWERFITDYSKRQLMLIEDRLPAIAGIISELGHIWRDTCFAGLWKKFMIHHLGWFTLPETEAVPASIYTAPTWSWLSVSCPVLVPPPLESVDAEVIECVVIPLTSTSPLGRLQNGRLVLRALGIDGRKVAQNQRLLSFYFDYKIDAFPETAWFIKLGRTQSKMTIGLVLRSIRGRKYERIGYWSSSNNLARVLWRNVFPRFWTIT
ncbi:hypothetical protein BP6252_13235 [Coleophoma cylindrospora]|uniref:Heterokaryon incompatibility domain-containing protein n=1 Tax=Coleophoma cylindrospora TaxID=1849047 RepID=A0A3D8QAE0_9HELO|nr:hypothetical protein BP6252_13235 [Coleophoma cylindrospora]